jgi:hypothetical protein
MAPHPPAAHWLRISTFDSPARRSLAVLRAPRMSPRGARSVLIRHQHLPGNLHPFALRTCSMTGLRPSHCRNRPGSVAAPKPRMHECTEARKHGSTEARKQWRMFPCRAAPCLSSWVRSAARSERDDRLSASHGRTLLRHRTQVPGTLKLDTRSSPASRGPYGQPPVGVACSFPGSLASAGAAVLHKTPLLASAAAALNRSGSWCRDEVDPARHHPRSLAIVRQRCTTFHVKHRCSSCAN